MQKLTICILVLALVACTGPSRPKPERASPPTPEPVNSKLRKIGEVPSGAKFYMLHCVSTSKCWTGDYLNQWRTDDGGQHWQPVYAGKQFESEIRTVDYADERIGWIVTLGKIYKTADGGRNWTEQVSPIPTAPQGEVTAVKFLPGGQVGWITGGISRPATAEEKKIGGPRNVSDPPTKTILRPAIFHTEDGGKTWTSQSIPENTGRLYGPNFLNERQGVAIGDSGVFYTANGGKQWQHVDFKKSCTAQKYLEGYDMRPVEAFILDSHYAWMTFEDGRIARSSDGGQSWCDLPGSKVNFDYYEKYFKKIRFTNSNQGWGLGANRVVYETKDGGETWMKVLNEQFDDFLLLDNQKVLLVSSTGLFQLVSAG